MHVGTQQFTTTDEDLEYLARHGVFNKNENFITFHREYGWDVEELVAKKEKCARFGINMEMVRPAHGPVQRQRRRRAQLYDGQLRRGR